MNTWPNIKDETLKGVVAWIKQVTKLRNFEDVAESQQISQKYVGGRTVIRVPSSSSDVLSTDKAGDRSINTVMGTTYEYILVNISGSLTWQRMALGSF